MLASGVAVANSCKAKASGDKEEREKSTLEKVVVPDVTSGTLERVFAVVEHFMMGVRVVTMVATSAGRAVVPGVKQAFAWRVERRGCERVVVVKRRRVEMRGACILVLRFLLKNRDEKLCKIIKEWMLKCPSRRVVELNRIELKERKRGSVMR